MGSGRTVLVLDGEPAPGRCAEAVLVRLEGSGLSAAHVVHEVVDEGLVGLARFFVAMERSFRGWPGEHVFASVEGDLRIVATHLGHAVRLVVGLHDGLAREPWSVEATLELEPGEELSRAARDVADVVGPGRPG